LVDTVEAPGEAEAEGAGGGGGVRRDRFRWRKCSRSDVPWRKREGFARIRLDDGTTRTAEVHWYEAHASASKRSGSSAPSRRSSSNSGSDVRRGGVAGSAGVAMRREQPGRRLREGAALLPARVARGDAGAREIAGITRPARSGMRSIAGASGQRPSTAGFGGLGQPTLLRP
jgi:hypothetical protein